MTDYKDPIWQDENAPTVKQTAVVYHLQFPRPAEVKREDSYYLYVEVDSRDELATVQDYSSYLGKSFGRMDFDERMEVYEFLTEWEFCEWRKIGPEDRELFATHKLTGESA